MYEGDGVVCICNHGRAKEAMEEGESVVIVDGKSAFLNSR
jgi:hypothetical protein